MLNQDLLNSFIGHPIELRPAAGKDAVRDKQTTAVRGRTRLVAAAVTGVTERLQLRLETNDIRVMDFKDRAVYAEVNSSLVLLPRPGDVGGSRRQPSADSVRADTVRPSGRH